MLRKAWVRRLWGWEARLRTVDDLRLAFHRALTRVDVHVHVLEAFFRRRLLRGRAVAVALPLERTQVFVAVGATRLRAVRRVVARGRCVLSAASEHSRWLLQVHGWVGHRETVLHGWTHRYARDEVPATPVAAIATNDSVALVVGRVIASHLFSWCRREGRWRKGTINMHGHEASVTALTRRLRRLRAVLTAALSKSTVVTRTEVSVGQRLKIFAHHYLTAFTGISVHWIILRDCQWNGAVIWGRIVFRFASCVVVDGWRLVSTMCRVTSTWISIIIF